MDFKMRYVAIALLVIFVVMGVLNSATGQIAEAAGVPEDQIQSGLDIAMIGFNMMQEEDPRAAMVFLLTFLLVPVGIMYALIYGILDEVGHNYLSEKVIQPLSVLLAMTTLFSGAFVALSAAIGAFGLYLVGGAGAIALYFIADEWYVQSSHRHKEQTAKMGLTDQEAELKEQENELREEIDDLREEMLDKIRKATRGNQWPGENADPSHMKNVGLKEYAKAYSGGPPSMEEVMKDLAEQEPEDYSNIDGLYKVAQRIASKSGLPDSTASYSALQTAKDIRKKAQKLHELDQAELKEVEKDIHGG